MWFPILPVSNLVDLEGGLINLVLTLAFSLCSFCFLLLLGAVFYVFFFFSLVAGLEAMLLTVLCCSQWPRLYAVSCQRGICAAHSHSGRGCLPRSAVSCQRGS